MKQPMGQQAVQSNHPRCCCLVLAANSNTEELARRAEAVRQDTLLQDLKQQLEERRARVRELRSYMDAQVTETQLIKVRGWGKSGRGGLGWLIGVEGD